MTYIRWIGWGGDLFYWGITRFNSGQPYKAWRFGPIKVMRYF